PTTRLGRVWRARPWLTPARDLRTRADVNGLLSRITDIAIDPGRRQDRQSPGVHPQSFPDLAADHHCVSHDARIPTDVSSHADFLSCSEEVAPDADLLWNRDLLGRD